MSGTTMKFNEDRRSFVQHEFFTDPIQNFRIAITVHRIEPDEFVPEGKEPEQREREPSPFGVKGESGKTWANLLSWQQKVFCYREAQYYSSKAGSFDEENQPVDNANSNVLTEYQNQTEGSYRGNTIFTYISHDSYLPDHLTQKKLIISSAKTNLHRNTLLASMEGNSQAGMSDREAPRQYMHIMLAIYDRKTETPYQIGEEWLCTLSLSKNGRLDIQPPLLPSDSSPYSFLSTIDGLTYKYTIENASPQLDQINTTLEQQTVERVYEQNYLESKKVSITKLFRQPYLGPEDLRVFYFLELVSVYGFEDQRLSANIALDVPDNWWSSCDPDPYAVSTDPKAKPEKKDETSTHVDTIDNLSLANTKSLFSADFSSTIAEEGPGQASSIYKSSSGVPMHRGGTISRSTQSSIVKRVPPHNIRQAHLGFSIDIECVCPVGARIGEPTTPRVYVSVNAHRVASHSPWRAPVGYGWINLPLRAGCDVKIVPLWRPAMDAVETLKYQFLGDGKRLMDARDAAVPPRVHPEGELGFDEEEEEDVGVVEEMDENNEPIFVENPNRRRNVLNKFGLETESTGYAVLRYHCVIQKSKAAAASDLKDKQHNPLINPSSIPRRPIHSRAFPLPPPEEEKVLPQKKSVELQKAIDRYTSQTITLANRPRTDTMADSMAFLSLQTPATHARLLSPSTASQKSSSPIHNRFEFLDDNLSSTGQLPSQQRPPGTPKQAASLWQVLRRDRPTKSMEDTTATLPTINDRADGQETQSAAQQPSQPRMSLLEKIRARNNKQMTEIQGEEEGDEEEPHPHED
ncbi:putative Meckel syndrome type 1 protein [Blattamonas nauphoetae]|uniref:Meckel syndrome type 1 protein n=1 Tax=Blattamonas nauphoetae TaxID=2049346 RepID=A0ABQ9XX01_9EUKA|nr:putative Meckel syndrome type 1 protein [Blattamonas nauphoetae]